MYASCPRYYDEVGRGNLTKEQEREILEKLPAFDSLTARSARDNGALVEFFRTYPASCVNRHVARFVFSGKRAERLMSRQPWNYPLGLGSPLERFLMLDGKIVLLGSDHNAVTFLHYVEHVVDMPGKRIARYQVPVIDDAAGYGVIRRNSTRLATAFIRTGLIAFLPRSWTACSRKRGIMVREWEMR
jgi:aminoglycoside 3-N-acetyltransferase